MDASSSSLQGVEAEVSRPQPGAKRRFHAMVKPIGSTCNLDCAYCYYLSKEKLLDQQPGKRISDTLLAEFIRQYILESVFSRAVPAGPPVPAAREEGGIDVLTYWKVSGPGSIPANASSH